MKLHNTTVLRSLRWADLRRYSAVLLVVAGELRRRWRSMHVSVLVSAPTGLVARRRTHAESKLVGDRFDYITSMLSLTTGQSDLIGIILLLAFGLFLGWAKATYDRQKELRERARDE